MRLKITTAVITSISILSMFTGCITVNVPIGTSSTSQVEIWKIDYLQPGSWGYTTEKMIRIDDFRSVNFLNSTEIVIQLFDGTLNIAETDIWDTFPGKALPDFLTRDMLADGYYAGVFRSATVLIEDITVNGFIRQFGGKVTSDGWEAVLDIDVTVSIPFIVRLFCRRITAPSIRLKLRVMLLLLRGWEFSSRYSQKNYGVTFIRQCCRSDNPTAESVDKN